MSLAAVARSLAATQSLVEVAGHVVETSATGIRVAGLSQWLNLGDWVRIETPGGNELAEVIKLDRKTLIAKPFSARVRAPIDALAFRAPPPRVAPDASWKGRVLDALGGAIDDIGALAPGPVERDPNSQPPQALTRGRVAVPLSTGIGAIDLLTPICAGQRIGIFAGSGVGKTTLLSMLMEAASFDTVVVSLVGERGREVRETIEETLASCRHKSIAVVATSDESPMMRRQAPVTATSIAEHFCAAGENVLLVVDSVTRYAHALREVALAAGEPPVARGYPPSVFTALPHLLERSGPGTIGAGTITGVYSVLVDGDDHNEPIADCIRGTLDGHIVLDRSIAQEGRFPAIDPLASLSRLAHLAWTRPQAEIVRNLLRLVARFEETKDLRSLSAYKPGIDVELDKAVLVVPKLYDLLKHSPGDQPRHAIFDQAAALLA